MTNKIQFPKCDMAGVKNEDFNLVYMSYVCVRFLIFSCLWTNEIQGNKKTERVYRTAFNDSILPVYLDCKIKAVNGNLRGDK